VLFGRKKPVDRASLVVAGDRARSRGRVRKAIVLYRKALDEPAGTMGDATVHGKLAPLLARKKLREEALGSFAKAASGQVKAGFVDRAVALLKQALDHYPDEAPLWDELVRLQLLRGRRPDAVAALVSGGRRLHRTRHLEVAERTLARAGRKREAMELLEAFGLIARGLALRRARRLAFRLSPTPRNLWRWIRAAWRGR